jgi:hypothetical protein
MDDFLGTTEDPHGIHSECKGQVLKIEKQLLWNLLRIKKSVCRGEGYFIRVLEVLRQTGNRFGF